jgi:hypothetical protein
MFSLLQEVGLRVSEKLAAVSLKDEINVSLYALYTIALRLLIFVT